MKSIISRFYSNYGFSFIYVILAYTTSAHNIPSCGLYGAPPCQFVPAPPGQTPACARPGRTYCEHADNYPTYIIKRLVNKWGYEAKNLLIDETWDEFAALAWHETSIFYDPSFIFPQRPYNGGSGSGNSGASGSGTSGSGGRGNNGAQGSTGSYSGNNGPGDGFGGYKYNTPSTNVGNAGESTFIITKQQATETPTFLLYTSAGQRLNKNQVNSFRGAVAHKYSSNNPTFWLKRVARGTGDSNTTTAFEPLSPLEPPSEASRAKRSITEHSTKLSRDVSLNMDLFDIVGVGKGAKTRTKRQSPGRSTLCRTNSQFITPQAALNNKGNWMFVVNEPTTARQMVKAELCASDTCSNLCQLPNGYNSRCEQKYVQKRLIALQASGQNLYTDTFWFPSCCVCTIAAM